MPFAIASRALRRLTGEAWVFDPVGAAVRIMPVIGDTPNSITIFDAGTFSSQTFSVPGMPRGAVLVPTQ